MSRIGKQPVLLASGVEVVVTDGTVRVKGPKGELATRLVRNVRIEIGDGQLQVHRESDDKPSRALHGLMRSLLNNMVTGVTTGFTRELQIVGVGYRAEVKGQTLVLSVGYSHPVEVAIPQGLEVKMDGQTKMAISGVDKQCVGQFASEVRKVRPPEPYKGKGIRYAGEQVRRKVGKAAVGA
jgi:large subunit ribosomal protein L6